MNLCQKDSDQDGKTNGEELGDPNCQWTEGATPELISGLTHPGSTFTLTSWGGPGVNIIDNIIAGIVTVIDLDL